MKPNDFILMPVDTMLSLDKQDLVKMILLLLKERNDLAIMLLENNIRFDSEPF